MKNKYKTLLVISLLVLPTIVFASNGGNDFPVVGALLFECATSFISSFFVFLPLSEMITKYNSKKTFWILFAIRVVILLFCDFFISTMVAVYDVLLFMALGIIIFSIYTNKNSVPEGKNKQTIKKTPQAFKKTEKKQVTGIELRCANCKAELQITDEVCSYCGTPFDGNNVIVSENKNKSFQIPEKVTALSTNFDKIYCLPEDKMLDEFINIQLTKVGLDKLSKLIPSNILKRKKKLNNIFSILVFIFISLIFFHFSLYTYIIGIVVLVIFFIIPRRFDLIKYLKKQIKERPSEKISNIMMEVKNSLITDNSKDAFIRNLLISIILPLIIFSSPRILYEKVEGGYAVRYYIFGITNFKSATIPEIYNNKKVVSLRENTFSNMPFLESVSLPNSITEIRGQAFKNCYKLAEVNIPKNLEYLGDRAFYNNKSIKRIELPDTLTYLGRASFYGTKSLEYIKLSNNLTEIKEESFKYCESLSGITIPDNIIRIDAHAFYENISLSEVLISENSKLNDIGLSAFKKCESLNNIKIPSWTQVNQKAFAESPTFINRYEYNSYNNGYENYYE